MIREYEVVTGQRRGERNPEANGNDSGLPRSEPDRAAAMGLERHLSRCY